MLANLYIIAVFAGAFMLLKLHQKICLKKEGMTNYSTEAFQKFLQAQKVQK